MPIDQRNTLPSRLNVINFEESINHLIGAVVTFIQSDLLSNDTQDCSF